jgi:hypothetical protein
MPGSEADLKDILRAVDSGELTREELLRNASRILNMIRTLHLERKKEEKQI